MIWGAGVYLANSQEEAIRKLEPAHDERFKWFAPFGFVRYATSRAAPGARPARRHEHRRCATASSRRPGFCGPPAQVIDGIKSIA